MIDRSVLEQHTNGNGEPAPPGAVTRQLGPLPSHPGPGVRTGPLPPPTDPQSIQQQLDAWAAKHDELTSQYAEVIEDLAVRRHELELEKANARERAKHRRNARDRRTNDDLRADVTRSQQVEPLERAVVGLDARAEAIRRLLRNAELNIDRLRTAAASARVVDYRGA